MKLSKLIAYQKSINEYDLKNFRDASTESLDLLTYKLGSLDINEDYQKIIDLKENIINSIDSLELELSQYKEKIVKNISSFELEYLRKSYSIYEEMHNDDPNYILNRENTLTVDNSSEFQKRIDLYSSWKYSGMYIRPGKNRYIESMISCDPLYIVDEHVDLFAPVKKLWNKEYQDRLRYKLISDNNERIFRDFPENQFGFIVATTFFDYKPFEVIKKYLIELYQLLKPGGIIIFTYNNCDMPGAVRNVENMFNCYTPGRLLKNFIISLNYELLYSVETPSGLNWLEIKKPGKLTSIRGGQALAKIIAQKSDII